jgi:uncharacterized glyoxalase superfamily protein PhnB
MRYRDVAAAVEWLRSRLGFELHSSVRDDDGVMVYAQVAFGNAMVMLAPIQDTALDRYMRQPAEIGGAETQSCYFHVADAVAHFTRAKAAGAEIILPLQPYDSGGQGYSCRDPEGHIWTFGDFDPWGRDGGEMPAAAAAVAGPQPRRRLVQVLGLLAVLGASGAAAAWYSGVDIAGIVGSQIHAMQERSPATVAVMRETDAEGVNALQARLAAETTAREAAVADLQRERELWEAARREMGQMRSRVSAEAAARVEIEAKLAGMAAEAERERAAREDAERTAQAEAAAAVSHQAARMFAETAARDARAEADKLRSAKSDVAPRDNALEKRMTAEREAAEAGLRQAREELQRERGAREAAEKASQEALRRAEAAETAGVAAAASVTTLRAELAAEQAAKRSAWNAINALRKQMAQAQRTKAAATAAVSDADAGAEPAPAVQPKSKQVLQRQPPPRKRKPAPAEE